MKKILIALIVLLIVVVAGLAIFVLTFDINRYNKEICYEISKAVGNKVEIGRLSLGWKGRINLSVENFQIIVEKDGEKTPELSFERGDMALELLPLLQKQLKISSIFVSRPKLHLVKSKEGAIEVRGYNAKPEAPAVSAAGAAAPIAVNFSISSIVIRDGAIRFEDCMTEPPAEILIDSLDADINNVSLVTPVQFAVKMSLLGQRQNANISGTAGGFTVAPMYVKNLIADIDIGAIDHIKLIRAFPAVKSIGITKDIAGILKAKVHTLELVDGKISKLSSDIEFTGGKISLAQLKAPVENIDLSASAEGDKLSVKSFSAGLANATLKSSGTITNIFAEPRSDLSIAAQIPSARQFISSVAGGRQYLDGKIAFGFDGSMSGASWDAISKTLSGTGKLSIDNGVLLDANVLKQTLQPLYMFPGLIDSLGGYIPAKLKDALGQEYTLLAPINQAFTVENGVVALPDMKVKTDFADISAAADLTLQGDLTGNGIIIFTPELSDAMIKTFPQMQYLANQQKMIEFPIEFKASGGRFSVMPDLQYIGTKVAIQKGQEMMTKLLKKATEPKTQSGTAVNSGQSQGASKLDSFIANIKTIAAEAQKSSGGTSQ